MAYYVDASGNVVTYDPVTGQTVQSGGDPTGGPQVDPGFVPQAPASPPLPGPEPPRTIPSTGGLFGGGGTPVPNPDWAAWKAKQDALFAWAKTNPLGPQPSPIGGAPQAPAQSPGMSPTDPAFWQGLGNSPPWISAGFPDFASWSVAVGQNRALQTARDEAALALTRSQIGNVGAGNASNAMDLAERQRQFNETLGSQKAQFDQRAVSDAADRTSREALSREQLDVQRGNTLLGLGSRPETVARYLYALGGKQAPQQLGGVAPALPGYPGTNTLPANPAAAAAAPPLAPASLNLPPQGGFGAPVPNSTPLTAALPSPAAPSGTGNLPSDTMALSQLGNNPALNDLLRNANSGVQPFAGQDISQTIGASWSNPQGQKITVGGGESPDAYRTRVSAMNAAEEAKSPGWTLRQLEANTRQQDENRLADQGYADGGEISEPMIAVGLHSGRVITLGEEAPAKPEVVVPEGKTVAEVKHRSGKTSYADGGSLGYAPDYAPKSVFNPPMLSDIVSRGYNTPGVPLMPQVATLTGNGQSLIPSSQSLFNALPSERASYSGFLQDEAGVAPQDVFELTRRLAPQVTGLRTPRFAE